MKKSIFAISILFLSLHIWAQSHISTQSHQAAVSNIFTNIKTEMGEDAFFTSGEDGFVIRWTPDNQGEHYQISDVGIKLISVSPDGNLLAVYESDGGSVNKVSVWDWKKLNRIYQKKFNDSITALSFSSKGTYLIVGTATVDGAIFIKTGEWTIVDKIKTNTSIVNYINTSSTEKTVAFYSPAGSISYYNLSTGKIKGKLNTIQGLTNPVMFNENKFLAGLKDEKIYIINAFTGSTVSSISCHNPIIISNSKDYNLYYSEYDGKNNYTIYMLENNNDDLTVSNPRIVKTFRGPRGQSSLNIAAKDFNNFYFGSRNGSIYVSENVITQTTENILEITEDIYAKILDIDTSKEDFYFLTNKGIYLSSYDSGIINKLIDDSNHTNISTFDENSAILWTKSSNEPVVLVDFTTKTKTNLFTPKSSLQNLRICLVSGKKYIIEIESNSIVNIFDFENKKIEEIYSGTGVQDAILTNDGNIYIAKSSASNPQVPLLCVNMTTKETVPLSLKGKVAYALTTDGDIIYGMNLISQESGSITYVFSYDTKTKIFKNILKFSNEDSDAFTYLYKDNLYTNIGKNKVYCYNLISKKRFSYNRSASIPKSLYQNKNRVVILNNDGSISWCGPNSSSIIADWYLTNDEQWYEF